MSKTTKRKHVMKEIMEDDFEVPKENQNIVKVIASKGNNLHEVESASGDKYLVSMPTKFRKNIWVKRGDFILVEPIIEGDKVKGEIVKILTPDTIKYYKKNHKWPTEFSKKLPEQENNIGDDILFVNTNRISTECDKLRESSESSSSD